MALVAQQFQQLEARAGSAESQHALLVRLLDTGLPNDKIKIGLQLYAGNAPDQQMQQKFN